MAALLVQLGSASYVADDRALELMEISGANLRLLPQARNKT